MHARLATTRRDFLTRTAAGLAGASLLQLNARPLVAADEGKPMKVAALINTFYRSSHAHVILENFLVPYLFNGKVTQSGMQVASFYVDQIHPNDMSRDVAKQFQIPIYPTITEALCLGGEQLAVDAVLLIGEHGNYPTNAKAQVEYPRKQFFDSIVAVYKRGGRVVPIFCDKHLSFRWDWAKEMVDTARELKIPLMAGSSVPLAERRPPLELPEGVKITQAVSIHGGGLEGYDFHALEVLESMIEDRAGGESGVRQVQFLEGEPLWKAAEAGLWSADLAAAAMTAEIGRDHELTRLIQSRGKASTREPVVIHGIVVQYRDGLRGVAMKVGNQGIRWDFACQVAGETKPRATSFYVGPWSNRNLFRALAHAIQTHFREGKPPYPVERTLLTSGILDAAMDSRLAGGKPIETPQLTFSYPAQDFRAMREMGATWKIITDQTREPAGIEPVGI
ncbi:MAG: hypothetical protein HY288_06270 [Planctomycetia bacterium]|nr:hypothetical protein [Planctomycetia bacterium]